MTPAPHHTPRPAVAELDAIRSLLSHDLARIAELLALLARPAWHAEAACRGIDTDLWFPTRQQGRPPADLLALCPDCPVHTQCAEAGTTERYGWWAGRPASGSRRPRDRHRGGL